LKRLAVAIIRQGDIFVWESATEWEGDRGGLWTQSSCEAIDAARDGWIRVISAEGAYQYQSPNGKLPDPVWPDLSYEEILFKAYKGRIITDIDHKLLRELRGEE